MHQITYQSNAQQYEEVVALLGRVNDLKFDAFLRGRSGVRAAKALFSTVFTLLVFVPLAAVFLYGTPIKAWLLVYLTIVSFIYGVSAAFLMNSDAEDKQFLFSLARITGTIEVRISENGLESESARTVSVTPWDCFSEVVFTEHYVLLMRSKGTATFIPTNAFSSQQELDGFLAEVAAQIRKASNNEAKDTDLEFQRKPDGAAE